MFFLHHHCFLLHHHYHDPSMTTDFAVPSWIFLRNTWTKEKAVYCGSEKFQMLGFFSETCMEDMRKNGPVVPIGCL